MVIISFFNKFSIASYEIKFRKKYNSHTAVCINLLIVNVK